MMMVAKVFVVLAITVLVQSARADQLVRYAGGGERVQNTPAPSARLNLPFGVHPGPNGDIYIIELMGSRLLRVDGRGLLWVVGGTEGKRGFAGDNGPVAKALFNGPHSIDVAPDGKLLIADTWNNRVRLVDPVKGEVSTFAGTGVKGFSGDGGPAKAAQFGGIYCASLDSKGKVLYLADLDNRRIRGVDMKTGTVTTIAGNGKKGVPKDGALASESPLVDPRAVIADGEGNVYILERGGHSLRRVDKEGRIKTIVGTGKKGNSGDGGKAEEATLNGPKHLCFDQEGNIIIADTENHVIRKYDVERGTIDRIAGTGVRGKDGVGGEPLSVQLNKPHGVFVTAGGTLYISDSLNQRVLKWEKTDVKKKP